MQKPGVKLVISVHSEVEQAIVFSSSTYIIGVVVLAAVLAVGPVMAEAGSLVTNGDFSDGLKGWEAYSNSGNTTDFDTKDFDVNGDGTATPAGFIGARKGDGGITQIIEAPAGSIGSLGGYRCAKQIWTRKCEALRAIY